MVEGKRLGMGVDNRILLALPLPPFACLVGRWPPPPARVLQCKACRLRALGVGSNGEYAGSGGGQGNQARRAARVAEGGGGRLRLLGL